MSKVSTIYDAVGTQLATLFTSATRIPDPYNLDSNNDQFLRDGFGVKVGSSEFQEFEYCKWMVSRQISVVFTKEVFRLDSDYSKIDDVSKALLEAVYETQKLFFNYSQLGIEASIMRVDILSSSEVQTVQGEKSAFYSMECSFNFLIQESF
jgi:hypothetical protein